MCYFEVAHFCNEWFLIFYLQNDAILLWFTMFYGFHVGLHVYKFVMLAAGILFCFFMGFWVAKAKNNWLLEESE